MSEEVITIVTEYKCPKNECQHVDGGARLVKEFHQSNEQPVIPNCVKCGQPMQAIRCWGQPFQKHFE